MNYVSQILRVFAACVAAACAALVVWYAAYAIMWLLMWLVATLAACGAAYLVGCYVNNELGGVGTSVLDCVQATLMRGYTAVSTRFVKAA